jgi:imidazoleglycerol-phosphate dehydratase / histidinol-phosphatase
MTRIAEINRQTNETKIQLELNLDGSGKFEINTGIGFLDHMLAQLARHGNFDLKLVAIGDLEVDGHHTIEDVAISLGQGFREALGSKDGIERFGFYLCPLDEALSQVVLDLSGRPWLVWEGDFLRPGIGNFPTEMVSHFFKSFSDNLVANISVKISGSNDHHKIESSFKALARSLKMAVKITGIGVSSTKGQL